MLESNGHYDLNAARKAGYRLLERLDAEEALLPATLRTAPERVLRDSRDERTFAAAARAEPPG